MRNLRLNEISAVAGSDYGAAAINAPTCPPGYVGVVLAAQVVTTYGYGMQANVGAVAIAPAGSVQVNTAPTSTATTTAQICLPDLTPRGSGSSGGGSSYISPAFGNAPGADYGDKEEQPPT